MKKALDFVKSRYLAILSIWISFVFIQSLFFKFAGSPETVHIFSTIGDWMAGNFLAPVSAMFIAYGGYATGVVELIASSILLYGVWKKRSFMTAVGSLMALGVISGAIFFHLFTPLGINVQDDGGALFFMAVTVFVSSAFMLSKTWKSLIK